MKDLLQANPQQEGSADRIWFNQLAPIPGLQEVDILQKNPGEPAKQIAWTEQRTMQSEQTDKGSMLNRDPLNHANFGLLPVEKRRFGSFGVSLLVNGLIVAAVLILTIAQVHEAHVREHRLQLTYLAQPKPYVPPVVKVKMPPIPLPKTEAPRIVPPKPVEMPEPPKVEPIKAETKAPVIPVPAARPVVQPPAPVVGRFSTPAPAAAPKVAEVAKAAGFGEASGVAANPNANRPANIAAVGGFGTTAGATDGAATRRGVVQGAGFGTGTGAGNPNGSTHGVVAAGGFGTGTQAASAGSRGAVAAAGFGSGPAAPASAATRTPQSVTTSIVVISKPLPQYTPEAREMRIEGDVTLEVRFTASGEVDVLRVVNGLGHGLDEQARLAAQKIRFKPATRDGKPVDQVSVIHVAFQLA